jgi:hypothetical protein
MAVLEGRDRLRQWAHADNVQDLGARVAALEVIAELEAAEARIKAVLELEGNWYSYGDERGHRQMLAQSVVHRILCGPADARFSDHEEGK